MPWIVSVFPLLAPLAVALLLSACAPQGDETGVPVTLEEAEAAAPLDADSVPPADTGAAPPADKPVAQQPLNLSLPAADNRDSSDLFAGEDEDADPGWFKEQDAEEKRLEFKSKLLMKEGAEFDKGPQSYHDSVDGAEFGFEYKTK